MLTISSIDQIKARVLEKLKDLDSGLTYHRLEHTLDVLEQAQRIAGEEGINDEHDLLLLQIASLYHDTGFLGAYQQHEENSCSIFLEDATQYNLSDEDRQQVVSLIMATKIPQQPATLLEKILYDADLDYLGRDDFFKIGNELKKELIHYGIILNEEEWENLQLNFLSRHQYHTESSKRLREPAKQLNMRQL